MTPAGLAAFVKFFGHAPFWEVLIILVVGYAIAFAFLAGWVWWISKLTSEKGMPDPTARRTFPERFEPGLSETNKSENRRVSDLTHKQISDAIEAVPPLQRDGIEASFVGTYVCWRGKLFSASKRADRGFVTVDDVCKDGGLVNCNCPSANCDVLLIIPGRSDITVKGKIKRISKYEAELEDCIFEIPQKPEKPDSAPLIIHSAFYGVEGIHFNVMEIVQAHLVDGRLEIRCGNDLFGDPCPGKGKIMTIDYSVGGKRLKKFVMEGEFARLP
jgi:hypothetical protein